MKLNDVYMRSFFYLLQNEKDKTTVNYDAEANKEKDMCVTSLAAQKLHKRIFGDA